MLKGDSDDSDEAFCHILTKTKNYGNSQKVAESAWSVSRSPVHSGKPGGVRWTLIGMDWNSLDTRVLNILTKDFPCSDFCPHQ